MHYVLLLLFFFYKGPHQADLIAGYGGLLLIQLDTALSWASFSDCVYTESSTKGKIPTITHHLS